jgi:hypothetical protein
LFVIEKTGADGESPSTEMDLRLLVWCEGRQRGLSELTTLAERAGLRVATVNTAGDLSVVELVVASA